MMSTRRWLSIAAAFAALVALVSSQASADPSVLDRWLGVREARTTMKVSGMTEKDLDARASAFVAASLSANRACATSHAQTTFTFDEVKQWCGASNGSIDVPEGGSFEISSGTYSFEFQCGFRCRCGRNECLNVQAIYLCQIAPEVVQAATPLAIAHDRQLFKTVPSADQPGLVQKECKASAPTSPAVIANGICHGAAQGTVSLSTWVVLVGELSGHEIFFKCRHEVDCRDQSVATYLDDGPSRKPDAAFLRLHPRWNGTVAGRNLK